MQTSLLPCSVLAGAVPTARTQHRRLPARGSHERADLDAILDEGLVCHVGFSHEGSSLVIPTGYARDGDRILLHGSRASRLMQALASGAPVCLTVTLLDGLVLARSGFHHSMNYRSAVVFGRASPITAEKEKWDALQTYVDRLVPGRWDLLRAMDQTETDATLAVELPIVEFSAKTRAGPPKDDAKDADFPAWAGVIPLELRPADRSRILARRRCPCRVTWRTGDQKGKPLDENAGAARP